MIDTAIPKGDVALYAGSVESCVGAMARVLGTHPARGDAPGERYSIAVLNGRGDHVTTLHNTRRTSLIHPAPRRNR